jgi:hypothetical protein
MKVDEDCIISDARVGSAGVDVFFSKTITDAGTSMCIGWRWEVSRILTSRSREGWAKLGGIEGSGGELAWSVQ